MTVEKILFYNFSHMNYFIQIQSTRQLLMCAGEVFLGLFGAILSPTRKPGECRNCTFVISFFIFIIICFFFFQRRSSVTAFCGPKNDDKLPLPLVFQPGQGGLRISTVHTYHIRKHKIAERILPGTEKNLPKKPTLQLDSRL